MKNSASRFGPEKNWNIVPTLLQKRLFADGFLAKSEQFPAKLAVTNELVEFFTDIEGFLVCTFGKLNACCSSMMDQR